MPNDVIAGQIVVASAYYTDDKYAVITMRPRAPYYGVNIIKPATGEIDWKLFANILEASAYYADLVG